MQSNVASASKRDPRVDLLRGFALLMIFVDHIPGDDLNRFTLRNLGFSDAAEIFVLLAGFASTMAYGGTFDRQGAMAGVRRIFARCVRLYLFQVSLLLSTLIVVYVWTQHFNIEPRAMAPLLHGGIGPIARAVSLQSQPSDLNILPLYMLLLGMFPPFYLLMRARPAAALALSALLWAATQFDRSINLTNALDGNGWFFDPFAWQFLFALGAGLAIKMRTEPLPRRNWLLILCWTYLAASFLVTAPWQDWGLPDLFPLHLATPDKTTLSPLRLLHVSAIVYVVLSSRAVTSAMRQPPLAPVLHVIEVCGKHSLEVFSLGTLLDLVGRLTFRTYGTGVPMQVAINVCGLSAMIALAWLREQSRHPTVTTPRTVPATVVEQQVLQL